MKTSFQFLPSFLSIVLVSLLGCSSRVHEGTVAVSEETPYPGHASPTPASVSPEFRGVASVDPTFGRFQKVIGREDCVSLSPFPGTMVDKGDAKDEEKLCEIVFEDPKLALCPASFSTNPATEVHELPEGMSREKFEQTECKKSQKKAGSKIAKFKQSTSCSHTSSILGYNKLAQALGTHVEIPTSVYRTMEIKSHEKVQEMARRVATSTIAQTWAGLIKQVAARNPKVVKDSFVYGALLDGVGGETRHPVLNKRGSSNPAGPVMATNPWIFASSSSSIDKILGAGKISSIPTFIMVRDISEMVVLDYIMAQQDRFGNIASRKFVYFIETKEDGSQEAKSIKFSKANKKDKDTGKTFLETLIASKTPFVDDVQRMILKDNDCGLRPGDNVVKQAGMLEKLRHLNPSVYVNLQSLAATDQTEMLSYLQKQLLMSSDEAKGVRDRLLVVAKTLRTNYCEKKTLMLDLDTERFMGLVQSAEIPCD